MGGREEREVKELKLKFRFVKVMDNDGERKEGES